MAMVTAPGVFRSRRTAFWGIAGLAIVLAFAAFVIPAAARYPLHWKLPVGQILTAWMKVAVGDISPVTRALAAVAQLPLSLASGLLSSGFDIQFGDTAWHMPALSWLGVCGVICWIGYRLGGARLALLQGAGCAYLLVFGQWDAAMLTVASVSVCVPVAVICGMLIGILAHLHPRLASWLLSPALDLMQTVPAFAYLVPTLLLFGFGPVAAMIATVIFALPPMARTTCLALDQLPNEIRELAAMIGCTGRQKLWRIFLPSAMPLLLVGLNQTVMMTLNMVIIGSMIGAGGLGFDVLRALRQLDIGRGFESGGAIVVLAIMLDRQGIAAVHKVQSALGIHCPRAVDWLPPLLWVLAATVLGLWINGFSEFPTALRLSTGTSLNTAMEWINVNCFDAIEAVRVFLLVHLMTPIKIVLVQTPWLLVMGVVTLIAYGVGGARLALLSVLVLVFCLVNGLWEKSMITLYLCLSATLLSVVIGVPLAMVAARSDRLYKALNIGVEILQTLPSFVYLIPVVMLFRVGDFTALIAIIAFAITPILKFTATALRSVPANLIEAGEAMGCSPRQLDRHIRFPMSLQSILLGVNQAILFALAMVVITALVGTRDLGQEVYMSLTSADPGRGLVAGLSLAFLGILIDRIFRAGVARLQQTTSAAPASA